MRPPTLFLDVRLDPVGGGLAASVSVYLATFDQNAKLTSYATVSVTQLQAAIQGRHVLIGTHGFKNSRWEGIDHLSNWATLLQFSQPAVFVGLLWPGDSVWAHGLDYPDEPKVANDAGWMIGPFLDQTFAGAASISFASHSLGARVVLATISHMNRRTRRAILMAGAIDNNCFNTEFAGQTGQIDKISVLASTKDDVLELAFPLGNLIGGIIAEGHPWFHTSLGRSGPAEVMPDNFLQPFQIPSNWGYGHGNYLQIDGATPLAPIDSNVPPEGTPEPALGAAGWQEAFSAAFVSARFS